MIEMGPNRYGKSAIRLVKLEKGQRHRVRDLTVDIALEGDFARAHSHGDNALVIPTDTMKNTVYALAPTELTGAIEGFGLVLARHFAAQPQVVRATVRIREHAWDPMPTPAGPALAAFVRQGGLTRVATLTSGPDGETIRAGIEDLVVMKTAGSAFTGYPRDRYTTLRETTDRIMATKVTASWTYAPDRSPEPVDFDAAFERVRATLLEVMAEHESPSVQASIWIIGRAILEREPAIDEVSMVLPNLHHWTVDLAPFGGSNDGTIFVATTEPHGLIEATVRRGAA